MQTLKEFLQTILDANHDELHDIVGNVPGLCALIDTNVRLGKLKPNSYDFFKCAIRSYINTFYDKDYVLLMTLSETDVSNVYPVVGGMRAYDEALDAISNYGTTEMMLKAGGNPFWIGSYGTQRKNFIRELMKYIEEEECA